MVESRESESRKSGQTYTGLGQITQGLQAVVESSALSHSNENHGRVLSRGVT